MNNDLIKRSEVIKTLEKIEVGRFYRLNVINEIKKIQSVEPYCYFCGQKEHGIRPQVTVCCENADEKTIEELKAELERVINEVRPPQGEWIECTKSGMPLTEYGRMTGEKWYGFKCSRCNFIYKGNALVENSFCQKCGADMRGEKNE